MIPKNKSLFDNLNLKKMSRFVVLEVLFQKNLKRIQRVRQNFQIFTSQRLFYDDIQKY